THRTGKPPPWKGAFPRRSRRGARGPFPRFRPAGGHARGARPRRRGPGKTGEGGIVVTTCCVLLPMLLAFGPSEKAPPPLTERQRTRIQELVRTTQKRAAELKAKLEDSQQKLAKLYAEFDLDQPAVEKLQKD